MKTRPWAAALLITAGAVGYRLRGVAARCADWRARPGDLAPPR